jgi:uncharacterized RDD family membrane protein YckC
MTAGHRWRVSAVLLGVFMLAAAASPAVAQAVGEGPRVSSSGLTITIGPGDIPQIDVGYIRFGGSPVVRVWQDYALASGREVRGAVVVAGNATIDGRVDGDLVVVLGSARLSSTAVVNGSVVVVAGDTTIAEGATIWQDLVVVGGRLTAPASFSPGHEYFVIGTPWLGDQVRGIVPWITRGLLLGRPLVPDLGWIWGLVFLSLIVALAVNVLLHGPVGACADTLADKPLSTFLAGLLVLLLTAPVALLLTATLIGLVIVPFLFCAIFVAWVVGRIAVARWIGRRVTRQEPPETPLEGVRSFLIGFAALVLLYMVPVIGFVVWGLVGVFGLGAASVTLLAGLRRERPPAPTPVAPEPPVSEPPSPPSAGVGPAPVAAAMSAADSLVSPPASSAHAHAPPFDSAQGRPFDAAQGKPTGAHYDLTLFPRATFLDRLAAFVLDVFLVIVAVQLTDILRFRDEGAVLLVLGAYFIAFWAWKGTTVGGIICNLRVVRIDGSPLRFVDALVRGLSSILSFAALGLGCFWILRDPEGQAWHDKVAGTYVVKVPRNFALA